MHIAHIACKVKIKQIQPQVELEIGLSLAIILNSPTQGVLYYLII